MKKHNQYGFSALELILVALVATAVVGIGFTVWRLQTKKSGSSISSSSTRGFTTKTYRSDGLGFSYTYPNTLKSSIADDTVTFESADYDADYSGAPRVLKGESIRLEGETTDGVDQDGVPRHITIDNYVTANFTGATDRAAVSKTVKTATINGLKTLQFDYMDTRETIFFVGDAKRISVTLTYPRSTPIADHDKAYNQIVNSIKQ